jgi:hypothetical protein
MKKQEMRDLIFDMLGSILTGTDFRLKKRDEVFRRKTAAGWQMIGVALYDYNPEFQFSLVTSVRIDTAEEVFHTVKSTPPECRSASHTIATRQEYFTGGPLQQRFVAYSADDVAEAGRVIRPLLGDKILPFLNTHSDVEALDRAVNRQTRSIDITNQPNGAMHAIILAHLAKDPDCDRIVTKYRTEWQLAPDADHPFNRLVEYLKTH